MSQTTVLEKPDSAQLSEALAGLKPALASSSVLNSTQGDSTVTADTPIRPMAAPGRKIACGMAGTRPTAPRISATGNHPRGSANCPPIWPVRSRWSETRVTIAAAAIDSSNDGTCATSASPTASVT